MAWKIDPSHTALGFAVRHMMITTVRGKFEKVDADIDIDAANLSEAKVSARIDAASVNTAEEKRDGHLRSPDFFDVEKYPTIEFKSTKVSQSGQDLTVEGLLKIKEAEHPITLKGEVIGPGKDPWGGTRIGFSLSAELEREKWGLNWNQALEAGGVLVAKKVKLELEVQLVQG